MIDSKIGIPAESLHERRALRLDREIEKEGPCLAAGGIFADDRFSCPSSRSQGSRACDALRLKVPGGRRDIDRGTG